MTDDKQEDATPALSGEQVKRMVAGLDALFHAMARPYWEFDDGRDPQPVWRAGNHGYVPEDAWDAVFTLLPDWARDAYAISWNDVFPTADTMGSRIAAAYNEGGMDALRQWVDRLDADGVAYGVRPTDTSGPSDPSEEPGTTVRRDTPDGPGMGV